MTRYTKQLLIDLGFRKDLRKLEKSKLLDLSVTHSVIGGIIWGVGTWYLPCTYIGASWVIVAGIIYIHAHVKNDLSD